jgi:hypothetical protein
MQKTNSNKLVSFYLNAYSTSFFFVICVIMDVQEEARVLLVPERGIAMSKMFYVRKSLGA